MKIKAKDLKVGMVYSNTKRAVWVRKRGTRMLVGYEYKVEDDHIFSKQSWKWYRQDILPVDGFDIRKQVEVEA